MAYRERSRVSRAWGGFGSRGMLILAAVLGLVAVAAVMAYVFWAGDAARVRQTDGVHFKCMACKREFVKRAREMTLAELNANPANLRVDCPYCGAKRAAVPMVRCPNPKCRKWFVPASYLDPAGKRAGRVKDICPYCQTDRDQWFREYYRKHRKR